MITAAQCRAARAILEWSQTELAERSYLGGSTIRDFEKGRRVPTHNNLVAIRRALEAAGMRFTEDGGVVPRIRVRAVDQEGIQFEMPIFDPMLETDSVRDTPFLLPKTVIQSVYGDWPWDKIGREEFIASNVDNIKSAASKAYERGPKKKKGKYIEITGEDFDLT